MRKLERIAYLKYMKKLIDQEVDILQREIEFPEEPVPMSLGSIQTQRNMAYTFDNNSIIDVTGIDLFTHIAKVSKSSLSAVLNGKDFATVMENVHAQPSAPFLKLTQVHYPAAKMAVKIGNKFRTILKLV